MNYAAETTIIRIQKIIQAKGLTQKKVFSDLGIGEDTMKRMTDKKGMSSFTLAKIADYLGVSVDYLLGRAESPILVATWDELYQMIDHMSDAQLDSLYRKIQDRLAEQQRPDGQGRR